MIPNSDSLEGQFLIAMPGMGDARFEKTVIYVCAHSKEGAMGFVFNKPLEEPQPLDFFEQLEIINYTERDQVPADVAACALHTGGPVEPGRGFVLHSPDYRGDTTIDVRGSVCMTATLKILRDIAMGRGPKDFLIALGYSGWSAGQLEEEIISNGWLTTNASPELIFDTDHTQKYFNAMQLMGINPSLLSAEAGHA